MMDYRTAKETELAQILDWAAEEGWNPGREDAPAFFAADPSGFFVACDGDKPVGAISVVNHTDSFAFLGLYLMQPSYRGRGFGYALWNHAIAHAGPRVIGLDGVPEQQSNYAASGFAHAGKTTRFRGTIRSIPHPAIRPAHASDIEALIEQEAAASGVRKPAYLSAWYTDCDTRKTLIHPEGFCTVRQCWIGAKVGPLVAQTGAAARGLLCHAAHLYDGPLFVDVPDKATPLERLCQELAMEPVFETARMYRGDAPSGSVDLFAVSTLELG